MSVVLIPNTRLVRKRRVWDEIKYENIMTVQLFIPKLRCHYVKLLHYWHYRGLGVKVNRLRSKNRHD